jgi:dihydroorotase
MPARGRGRPREASAEAGSAPTPERVLAGRAWIRGRLQPIELGIDADGTIVRLARNVRGAERRDLGERILLPSATDLHVHFRDPTGTELGENWSTGTLQAALGGAGLVGEMPNSVPPVTTVDRLTERRDRGRGRLAVDMLLYAAVQNPALVPSLGREAGGFKLYLSPTTAIDPPSEGTPLEPLLEAVADTGLPLAVHAEDPAEFREVEDLSGPDGWTAHRPVRAEERAVERVLASAPPTLRLHIAHVTCASVADRIAAAGVSGEVTPHHLLLAARAGLDARYKVNPPLRPEAVRAELWDRFAAGGVPCLASDHAPHTAAEKRRPFRDAPSGAPGVATMLPLLLARVRAQELELPRLLAAACDRPARWLGVPHGRLEVGHRANLVVVDFRRRSRIDPKLHGGPNGWTPFDGREAIFPWEHYLGGHRIVEDGEYVGSAIGRFRRPEYALVPEPRRETSRERAIATRMEAGAR